MSPSTSFILVLDHGTSSIRICLMNLHGQIIGRCQEAVESFYPHPGWVEQNPEALWQITERLIKVLFRTQNLNWSAIAAVGIANQRETTILWDSETGAPVYNAIVWQCRRTAPECQQIATDGGTAVIHQKTGLLPDPYFSASKIQWLLNHLLTQGLEPSRCQQLLSENRLCFGTVDSWILWRLTGGQVHATDFTNASRTLLFNIHERCWDTELLALFNIPKGLRLPTVHPSKHHYGWVDLNLTAGVKVPITAMMGDQQAALYGQHCWRPGMVKSTYGTGAFLMMNTGQQALDSNQGLLTTLAADSNGLPAYALEGAIFSAGASLNWLEKLFDLKDMDSQVNSIDSNGGVYMVPAFSGLGSPHWKPHARASILGLSQETGQAHLLRAALEAMAYQTWEVLEAMQAVLPDSELPTILKVDGGVTRSRFLMQFLTDIIQLPVLRLEEPEITTKGVGYLAGLAVEFWSSPQDIARHCPDKTERFEPRMSLGQREELLKGWKKAIALYD